MIISDRKIILYMGVPCTREWDYYTTRGGAVKCRVTFIPVRKELRHLRGHESVQLLNLSMCEDVQSAMMLLGLQLDEPEAAALFAALASSPLGANAPAETIADYLNA